MFWSDNKKKIILESSEDTILSLQKKNSWFLWLIWINLVYLSKSFFFFCVEKKLFLFIRCKIYMKVFVVDLFKGYEVLCLLIHLRKKIPQMTSSCRTFLLPHIPSESQSLLNLCNFFSLNFSFRKMGKKTLVIIFRWGYRQ